jgi:predicted Zn finger-like uncharacterized protein
MLIDCPTCARSYHVSPAEIEGGRTVICPRCDARWHVAGETTPRLSFGGLPPLGAPDRVFGDLPPAFNPAPPAERRRRRVPRGVTLGIASLALVSLTIGARAKIVQLVPRTAALYGAAGLPVNLRGLAFRDVHSKRVNPSAADIVVVGEIRNVAHARVRIPRLTFVVRDAAGAEVARWSETAPARLLQAGRSLPFASTPHAVPPSSSAVLVEFESGDA